MKKGICVFGEVLFDIFPDGRRIPGGAPFNVAWHLQAFGQQPHFVSGVGHDDEGVSIRKSMKKWGMDDRGLQEVAENPTGRVTVTFEDNEPRYEIVPHCAYDALSEEKASSGPWDLLYHGTLALREEPSRKTFEKLRDSSPGTLFLDVNLRSPWWKKDDVLPLCSRADWIKLNEEELDLLSPGAAPMEEKARGFLEKHELKGLVVTEGASGAFTLCDNRDYSKVSPPPAVKVVDTVGAGDAFSSVLILGILQVWPLEVIMERAQEFATRIVGIQGATAKDPLFYEDWRSQWNLPHP